MTRYNRKVAGSNPAWGVFPACLTSKENAHIIKMLAPKIIHQIWMQGWEHIPDKYEKNLESLHRLNPGFTFKRWDQNTLQAECAKLGQKYLDKFNSFDVLMLKVDFGRYVVLYNYGGISVDLDMFSLKPIETISEINYNEFIVSAAAFPANMISKINNALIITTKNNYILRELIDTILATNNKESDYLTKELYINYTTGPFMFNKVITKYQEALILDNKYFEPCLSVDLSCKVDKASIMDHQHELSWINPIFKSIFTILIFVLRYWWLVATIGILFYFKGSLFISSKQIYKSYITSKRR